MNKLKVLLAMLLFGSIGLFIRNIPLSSINIAFLRAVIGSLFLFIYSVSRRKFKKSGEGESYKPYAFKGEVKNNIKLLIISGMLLGFNWVFLFQGFKHTTISNATLVYYFAPVFIIIASPIVIKESFSKIKAISTFTAVIGLFLILDIKGAGEIGYLSNIKGIAFALLAAVFYASVVFINKFIINISDYRRTLFQLTSAAAVLFPFILFQKEGYASIILKFKHILTLDLNTWVLIIIVGIVHTGLSYLLYFSALKDLNAQSAAILSYIDPISAVVFASIFLKEKMTLLQLIGGILILGSTLFSEIITDKART